MITNASRTHQTAPFRDADRRWKPAQILSNTGVTIVGFLPISDVSPKWLRWVFYPIRNQLGVALEPEHQDQRS